VSNKCLRLAAAMMGVVCSVLPAGAQSVENRVTVRGEIRVDGGGSLTGLHVELSPLDHRGEVASSEVQLDGGFSFHNTPLGTYNLFVRTFDGGVVYRDLVSVLQQMTTLTVNLRPPTSAAGAPGTVSIKQLLHPPDRKALQALATAQHFSQSGDAARAVAELEKAIKISPDYAEAYNNLGVQQMHAGKMEAACENFRKALEITGPSAFILANLAIAQRELRQYPQAIDYAREALRVDRGFLPAHLVLGAVLIVNPETREEGISHLKLAAEKLEPARTLLDRVGQLPAAVR